MNKHSDGKLKPFKCEICKKLFDSRGKINYHMRIHSGEIYECEECS